MFPLVRLQSSLTKALSALDARIDQEHEIDRAADRNFGLEYMLGGLQSGELIVFAGRPFMGRTALVHHIAIGAAADRSIPVLVVSPEHDAAAVSERLLVAISGVNSIKFRIGMTSVEERVHIDAAAVALSNASLWIDETPAPRLRELERRIMRWRRSVPGASALVVIDSLSLVDLTRKRGGKHPLAKVARRLKGLAVAARIALIVVAEVGRRSSSEPTGDPCSAISARSHWSASLTASRSCTGPRSSKRRNAPRKTRGWSRSCSPRTVALAVSCAWPSITRVSGSSSSHRSSYRIALDAPREPANRVQPRTPAVFCARLFSLIWKSQVSRAYRDGSITSEAALDATIFGVLSPLMPGLRLLSQATTLHRVRTCACAPPTMTRRM